MTHVLYRKYRPKVFSDIVGQEHVVKTLKNAIELDKVAHAYLFTGPRGTGKTTMARVFTKSLNCTGRKKGTDACLNCNICKELENGSFIDLIEIDAASNRGIDEIRQLKEAVRFAPVEGRFKVYLIDEVHMLTKEAFNALLKMLEEPPSHALFILATTEPHKVLATIISRTQRFDFHFLKPDEILRRLESLVSLEKKKLDKESLRLIVTASGGSLRDAESMLGKVLALGLPNLKEVRAVLGLPDFEQIAKFFDTIFSGTKEQAIESITNMGREGSDYIQFAEGVLEYAHTLLLFVLSPSSRDLLTSQFSHEQKERIGKHAETLTERQLYSIIKEFIEAGNAMKYSPIPQLPLELAVINILGGVAQR